MDLIQCTLKRYPVHRKDKKKHDLVILGSFDEIKKETFESWLPKRIVEQFKKDMVNAISQSTL